MHRARHRHVDVDDPPEAGGGIRLLAAVPVPPEPRAGHPPVQPRLEDADGAAARVPRERDPVRGARRAAIRTAPSTCRRWPRRTSTSAGTTTSSWRESSATSRWTSTTGVAAGATARRGGAVAEPRGRHERAAVQVPGHDLAITLVASPSPVTGKLDTLLRLDDAGVGAVVLPEPLRGGGGVRGHHLPRAMRDRRGRVRRGHGLLPGRRPRPPRARAARPARRGGGRAALPSPSSPASTVGRPEAGCATRRSWSAPAPRPSSSTCTTSPSTPGSRRGRRAGVPRPRSRGVRRGRRPGRRQAVPVLLVLRATSRREVVAAGADGLVLFNRFYQPDLDLETLDVTPRLELSRPGELRLPLRWIAILRPQLPEHLAGPHVRRGLGRRRREGTPRRCGCRHDGVGDAAAGPAAGGRDPRGARRRGWRRGSTSRSTSCAAAWRSMRSATRGPTSGRSTSEYSPPGGGDRRGDESARMTIGMVDQRTCPMPIATTGACPTAAAVAAACSCPRCPSASGTTSATTSRSRRSAPSCAGVRPRHHALRPRQQLRPALRHRGDQCGTDPPGGLRRPPRRAGHLDQGRLGHVARPVRRSGLAQVPAGQPRPEPVPARARLRRHLLSPSAGPRHAAGGVDGRAATRQSSRARRCTRASRPTRRAARWRQPASCARWASRC